MKTMAFNEAIRAALHEEMQRDESVFVIGEDVATHGGPYKVTDGIAEAFPGRIFETPIAEAGIVGIGVGAVFFWISSKAKKRMDMIEEQLPDAVELMVRSLRVGHPFTSAISIVSKEIQDPLDLQGPDDPPWEGVHVFRNAKARLHQRRRAGEVGWFHTLGWYLYHLMTFWTLRCGPSAGNIVTAG